MLRMYAPRPLEAERLEPSDAPQGGWPSMSIVTPVRNQAAFVGQAIESVLGQRYPRLEYVVMDGASTDGTAQIAAQYRDRLHHFRSAPDRGQSDALNQGFSRCTGEIMGWLNGDDLQMPWTLALVGRFFAEHPEVDVVYGDRIVIDQNGMEVGRWVLPTHSDRILSWFDFVPQETLFWRRGAWERAGGCIDASYDFAMDWELIVRLRDTGARFRHLPRFLGAFRAHPAQKTAAEIDDSGRREMDRIRQRCLGRVPSGWELRVAAAPYLARHAWADLRRRMRAGAGAAGA